MRPAVTIAIVLHDDAEDLPACLEAVGMQTYRPLEIVVVDCASTDGGAALARRIAPAGLATSVVELGENRGFAGGMNAAFAASAADYFLTLNADALLAPDYAARLVERLESRPAAGAATGRLLRTGDPPTLDACGMYLSRAWRHFDRGSGEPDRGQFDRAERVFGATGAASLFRRVAVDDVALERCEMFDPRFHTFREDAELAFRFAERGWSVLYEPLARARHRRHVLPERRRGLSALANANSLRNRYLLRAYHQTFANLLWTLPATLARDLGALAYVLLVERTSLPVYGWLWRHRVEIAARRRAIRGRRTRPAAEIGRWFRKRALPIGDES